MENNNTNNTIVNNMLSHLDGWILDNQNNANVSSTKYNKKIKADELLYFYNVATDYALSYTQLDDVISLNIGCTAVCMWGAGLIWNKYNIRSNNQIDETNILGFGDKLIVQAKEMLKPYKAYSFTAY